MDAKNIIVHMAVCAEAITEQRRVAKEADIEAATAGINRITVFFEGNSVALFVKPSPISDSWFINFYGGGYMTVPKEVVVNFEIANQGGYIWRLSFNACGLVYWNNLIDQDMAYDLAEFLGLRLHTGDAKYC